jgi:hypothetical protein
MVMVIFVAVSGRTETDKVHRVLGYEFVTAEETYDPVPLKISLCVICR